MIRVKCPNCGYIDIFPETTGNNMNGYKCPKCGASYSSMLTNILTEAQFQKYEKQLDDDFEFNCEILNNIIKEKDDIKEKAQRGMKIIDHIIRLKMYDLDIRDRSICISHSTLMMNNFDSITGGPKSDIAKEIIQKFKDERKINIKYVTESLGLYHLVLTEFK